VTEPSFKAPNLYTLRSHNLQITYATTGLDGKPHLQYNDGNLILQFSSPDIRMTLTPIGTLVSVTLKKSMEAGSTSFSLLVPVVNLDRANHVPIRTFCISTIHRFSLVPILNHGQAENYQVTELTGSAAVVVPAASETGVAAGSCVKVAHG
jgi:hypothetical protein